MHPKKEGQQMDGPWTGGLYKMDHGKITKTVTSVKWEKGKAMLDELLKYNTEDNAPILYKRFEQIRGFLCHLNMVFDVITPYLKGFHSKTPTKARWRRLEIY